MKRLETNRLILRNFELNDANQIHKLFSDANAMRLGGMYPHFSKIEQTIERIQEWKESESRLAILKKDTCEIIGYIAINDDSVEQRNDTRELGYGIIEQFRRKGYMKEAISAVLEDLRTEGIIYVWASCFKENMASEKLILSMGFDFVQHGTYVVVGDRKYESLEFRIKLNKK